MGRMLLAAAAIFEKGEPLFTDYFAFVGKVVDPLALGALEFNAAFNFGHTFLRFR